MNCQKLDVSDVMTIGVHNPACSDLGVRFNAASTSWRWWTIALMVIVTCHTSVMAAEMRVRDVMLKPNGSGSVRVWGSIEGKPTVGWTVLLEITPRAGSRGTVSFTPSELGQRPKYQVHQPIGGRASIVLQQSENMTVDIRQGDDVWPGAGTFSPFDTSRTKSVRLNGAVDDNGTFVAELMTFSGELSEFPIEVSATARGVWDVTLSTASGASSWEGVPTTLHHATITVSPKACTNDRQCRDNNTCTIDRCDGGICRHDIDVVNCVDDGDKYRPGSRKGRSGRGMR